MLIIVNSNKNVKLSNHMQHDAAIMVHDSQMQYIYSTVL